MPYFFAISIVHHVLALTFNQKSKLIFLVSSGGTIEYYDFALFAIFADVIGETFFPSANHYTSMLGALLVFASGYLVRPLGGVIFSHFGDKYGRQQTFALTIGVMALSTLLMGLLPSYHTAGLSISILFVILRLLQGIALGGEIPGAVTYLLEQFPGRKSLISGIIFGFLSLGILIGNGINNVLAFILEGTQLEGAGWRIAFIIGGIACFLIYQSRKKLSETPAFKAIQDQTLSVPFLTLMSHQKLNIIKGVLMVASIATLVSLTMLYIQPYLSLLHQQRDNHLPPWVVILPMYVLPLSCVFWGWLFDRCNRYRMFGWVLLACIPGFMAHLLMATTEPFPICC
jgi:MFS family permease